MTDYASFVVNNIDLENISEKKQQNILLLIRNNLWFYMSSCFLIFSFSDSKTLLKQTNLIISHFHYNGRLHFAALIKQGYLWNYYLPGYVAFFQS